jgi:hypothetical protein
MRIALLVVAGLALVGFLVVAVVLPQMAGAEAREAAQALKVSASAEKSGKLSGVGKGVKLASKNDPKYGEMKWIVSDDGDIRGWNEKNALEVTMTPALQSGKASWRCKGYPIDAMPTSCGGRS